MANRRLFSVYRALFKAYGPQRWWPAKTRLECVLGAILTQNTAWSNVEKAIEGLRGERLLSWKALRAASPGRLRKAIRPSGFFNMKADRIKFLVKHIDSQDSGQLYRLLSKPIRIARTELLSINGIGPETADSIILYAGNKPTFVVDAYTRRIFARLGILGGKESYNEIQSMFEENIPKKASIYNEYHALIVRHAKEFCRKRPMCDKCPLNKICLKRI